MTLEFVMNTLNIDEATARRIPPDQLQDGDVYLLNKYAKDSDLILELGTCCGASAAVMEMSGASVITVDNYEMYKSLDHPDFNYLQYERTIEEKEVSHKNVLKWLKVAPGALPVDCSTSAYCRETKDSCVDMCFIDADHTAAGFEKDFKEAIRIVKNEGFILCHDARPGFGVWDYLEKWMKENNEKVINEPTPAPTSIMVIRNIK